VDHAKGLGIVLVVLGHVMHGLDQAGIRLPAELHRVAMAWMYSFHMPLFFLLAGLFLRSGFARRGLPRFAADKVTSLLYPYVLWSTIQWAATLGAGALVNRPAEIGVLLGIATMPIAHFWFLRTLFICLLPVALVLRFGWPAAVGLGLALLAALATSPPEAWGQVVHPFRHLPFLIAGVVALEPMTRLAAWAESGSARRVVLRLASVTIFAAMAWACRTGEASGWVHLPLAVAGIAATLVLAASCSDRTWARPLAALGAASLAIYLAHVLTGSGARIVLQRLLHVHDPWLHLACGMAAGLGVPWLAWRWTQGTPAGWLFAWGGGERPVPSPPPRSVPVG